MIDPVTKAPIEQPEISVVIGNTKYPMHLDHLAAYELSKMKCDPASIFAPSLTNKERVTASYAHVMDLFTASIAHNWVSVGRPAPTPAEVCALLPYPRDDEKVKEITDKVMQLFFPQLLELTKSMKLREAQKQAEPPTADPVLN